MVEFWDPDTCEEQINKCNTCKYEKTKADASPCNLCIHNPCQTDFWEKKEVG
ncbi:MAG: hypothetical protein ACOC44_12320 [Promethearchaeia archaeon]